MWGKIELSAYDFWLYTPPTMILAGTTPGPNEMVCELYMKYTAFAQISLKTTYHNLVS